ncbi:hypothetical protein BROUX41_001957 [Berkeleyomyces rouxiae]|uniref:uncharacterized protein n=1 Tax=Berkeleyomyces rouxiae TaxID=2035830 RepID=UPI003B77CFBF
MSYIAQQDISSLLKAVNGNSLRVKQLSVVLGSLGLSKHGVKAEQQKRLSQFIQDVVNNNNVAVFYQIMTDVHVLVGKPPPNPPGTSGSSYGGDTYHSRSIGTHSQGTPVSMSPADRPSWPIGSVRGPSRPSIDPCLGFKPSPFYEIQSQIGSVKTCSLFPSHRNTVTVTLRLGDNPDLANVANDNRMRIFVFCADGYTTNRDIAFPQQSQIRVNGQDLRVNLRGVKKRPGSTRPADITEHLRLRPSYNNNIDFTYEHTTKNFYLALYVCKAISVDELTKTISNRSKITKASVIQELTKTLDDPDIEATSQVLSLKCPLSYSRLKLPCRGTACRHIQCFDAESYLLLQQQAPTWQCPICNKYTPYEQLAIDQYVLEILETTAMSLEQVTIEPTGEWGVPALKLNNTSQPTAHAGDDDDDDDDLIIENLVSPKQEEHITYSITPAQTTPSVNQDNGLGAGAGTKRKVVIDLTFSDDEDDDVPAKRQATELAFTTETFDDLSAHPELLGMVDATGATSSDINHVQAPSWYASCSPLLGQYAPQAEDY